MARRGRCDRARCTCRDRAGACRADRADRAGRGIRRRPAEARGRSTGTSRRCVPRRRSAHPRAPRCSAHDAPGDDPRRRARVRRAPRRARARARHREVAMKRLVLFIVTACGHAHHHEEHAEPPAVAFTAWAANHEFFVEHPPFIVGQRSPLAAHVTKLAGHDPATAGTFTAILRQGAASIEATATAPARPGIFRPELAPTTAGPCTLVVRYGGDEASVPCVVHAAGAKLPAEEPEPPGRITYLKESAWTTEFETAPLAERDLVPTLRTTGEIRATAGREARLTATAHGRVLADSLPLLGTKVTAGQVLARIVPQLEAAGDRATLAADTRQARAELAAAEAELARSN